MERGASEARASDTSGSPAGSPTAAARRRSTVRPPKKPIKTTSSILSRLELAKERNIAARRIQRCWWRYVGGGGQERRHNAARVIQHAWGRFFMIENAKKELEFRRWMRSRRHQLRCHWRRVTYVLTLRQRWAIATVQQFARCALFRLRLYHARRKRCAAKLVKWYRKCYFLRRYGPQLQYTAQMLLETFRHEAMMRRSLLRQQRQEWVDRCRNIQGLIDAVLRRDAAHFLERNQTKRSTKIHQELPAQPCESEFNSGTAAGAVAAQFCRTLRQTLEERLQNSQPLVESADQVLPRPCPPAPSLLAPDCRRRPSTGAHATNTAATTFSIKVPISRRNRTHHW